MYVRSVWASDPSVVLVLEEGGGGTRPSHPSSPLIVWSSSQICVCKTKKAERCGAHWLRGSDKWMNRLFIVSDLFFSPVFFFPGDIVLRGRLNPLLLRRRHARCCVCVNQTEQTQENPLCCSYRWAPTPNHQLPQCTRLTRRREKKNHSNGQPWWCNRDLNDVCIIYNLNINIYTHFFFFFRKMHIQIEAWRRSIVNGRIHQFQ